MGAGSVQLIDRRGQQMDAAGLEIQLLDLPTPVLTFVSK